MDRLKPIEHTGCDAIAWGGVQWRCGPRFGPTLWTRSLMSDRRDAELMLEGQLFSDFAHTVRRQVDCGWPTGYVLVGGARQT